jgi:hypothetical protein
MLRSTVLFGVLVFALVTALTMRFEAMSDGYTTLGFPVTFLQYTGGKCSACTQYFRWHALALDLLLALAFAFGGLKAWKRVATKLHQSL